MPLLWLVLSLNRAHKEACETCLTTLNLPFARSVTTFLSRRCGGRSSAPSSPRSSCAPSILSATTTSWCSTLTTMSSGPSKNSSPSFSWGPLGSVLICFVFVFVFVFWILKSETRMTASALKQDANILPNTRQSSAKKSGFTLHLTFHCFYSLFNCCLTHLAPDRPSPPTLLPYCETPDWPVVAG